MGTVEYSATIPEKDQLVKSWSFGLARFEFNFF